MNSIESFWSRLKNSIRGTHVHVSKQHLWKYMKEFGYRYNRREKPNSIFSERVTGLGKQPLITHQSEVCNIFGHHGSLQRSIHFCNCLVWRSVISPSFQ